MTMMTAIEITQPGGPDVLRPVHRLLPEPAEGEVLIKVAAAGINRPDALQRSGNYPPPPGASDIPGLEIAGEIIALGRGDMQGWQVGDNVCALVSGGGYAGFCSAAASLCLPVPTGMSLIEAAGLPETFFTVWTNVFERGGLQPGEWLLVHGGSSGIGTTAIQLGKAFGAKVIATAGTDEKCKDCLELGATAAVNYRSTDFVTVCQTLSDGKGMDVILDMVGGPYTPRNHAAAALNGRIVQIATLQGARVEVDLRVIMSKRLTHTGSTLRPRTVAEKASIAAALRSKVWPLLDAGIVKPVIHATFPLAEASKAHALMESSTHTGKIILTA